MAKGYWIARVTVRDSKRYQRYAEASAAAFAKYGARFLVRGGRTHVLTGKGRERNVVAEFADVETALACFNSPEYQHAIEVRGDAGDVDLVIVEGHDGPQPGGRDA